MHIMRLKAKEIPLYIFLLYIKKLLMPNEIG